MAVQWQDDSIFNHFTVFEETFKSVGSHNIMAAILIPKGLAPGTHPAIFNFHGGFLVNAHSLFAPFFPIWSLKLALKNKAIIVSPDYRLLPSNNGVADVLEDLEDFWQWSRSDTFAKMLQNRCPGHSLDISRLLLTGSSAGGYVAMQLALTHPDDISAVATAYPFMNPKDPIMLSGPRDDEPTIMRMTREELPSKNSVLGWIEETKNIVATKAGFERTPFVTAAAQHGLYYSKIFDPSGLNRSEFIPTERLRAGARLPKKIWILHGNADSVVHLRTTQEFVDLILENLPDTTVRFDIASGEDHAFDHLNTSWELHAIGALDFVTQSWLGA
ncbi:Alpha/Beta hydrolase protein [Trichoderma evansii]